MLAFIGLALTSCDGHHPEPDMGMKVGDVLCTDGQILSMTDWEKSGKELALYSMSTEILT